MINIKKYTPYFHDGGLIDIQHDGNKITLLLESSEMDLSDIQDDLQLSERHTIKGKLHVKGVKSIQINGVPFSGVLKMKYDSASIVDFEIADNIVKLAVSWEKWRPKEFVNDFSTIKIIAEEMTWENIPDLHDPFW